MNAPLNKTLPPSTTTTSLGTESENKNNWIMANHDISVQEVIIKRY